VFLVGSVVCFLCFSCGNQRLTCAVLCKVTTQAEPQSCNTYGCLISLCIQYACILCRPCCWCGCWSTLKVAERGQKLQRRTKRMLHTCHGPMYSTQGHLRICKCFSELKRVLSLCAFSTMFKKLFKASLCIHFVHKDLCTRLSKLTAEAHMARKSLTRGHLRDMQFL
jgi:hypothetical protein